MQSARLCSILVGGLLASSVLAACGEDGPDAFTATETDTVDAEPAEDGSTEEGSVPASGQEGSAPASGEADVIALDNTFIDETVEVAAGTEVHWENRGRNDHDIAPVDDSESWGVDKADFVPGDTYSYVFTEPGEYPYYCTIHGTAEVGMIGTIIVT